VSALDRSAAPPPAPIRPFIFPNVDRSRLPNGLAVLSARHGHIPVVTAQMVIDAGAAREAVVKAGLAHLTANALDTGTRTRNGEALAWEFERLGVELHTEATWDAVLVNVTSPVTRLEPALALLADVVRNANFPLSEIERLRDEQLADILQRSKEPRALANDMAAHFIFGPDALYGRPLVGTAAYVDTLTRDDVAAFHHTHFVPGSTSLLLVGDIEPEWAGDLAKRHFGDWAAPAVRAVALPQAASPAARGTTVFVVDRPDAVQSEIRVGQIGVSRAHEDYFPLLVMNALLGGAFTSRLNLSLRERHGFTYGVRSAFAFRREPGPFIIQTAVATGVTGRAVEEILREVHAIRKDGASEAEVDNARKYLSGILPLELQTTGQLAGRLADLVIFGLPDAYFADYAGRIATVTLDDVNRVARDHLDVDNLAIVIVGDADAVTADLEAIGCGPVVRHDAPATAA
jgi:zinc protease